MPQHNKDSFPCCQHAGAGNSHDATSCLNTAETRFIVLEDGKIDVNPNEMEARLVRRRVVGEDDEHGACYLTGRDILKVRQTLLQLWE